MKKSAENLELQYKERLAEGCMKMVTKALSKVSMEDLICPDGKVLIISISADKLPPHNEVIQLEDALDYEIEEWENCIAEIFNDFFENNAESLNEEAIDISVHTGEEEQEEEVPEEIKELIRKELKNIKAKLLN